jgi:broad specificity phosphatase PhoE
MQFESIPPSQERKENPSFKLSVILHRHGPKEGDSGPLSEEGRKDTKNYYHDNYRGVPLGTTEVLHSGLERAGQTADIFLNEVDTSNMAYSHNDSRLSEGTISDFPNLRKEYGGSRGRWLRVWLDAAQRSDPDVKTGKEAVDELKGWLQQNMEKAESEGGNHEVDAFTHGPVIAALLVILDEKYGTGFLPSDWTEKDIFRTQIPYLSTVSLTFDSLRPNVFTVNFKDKKAEIPRRFINE